MYRAYITRFSTGFGGAGDEKEVAILEARRPQDDDDDDDEGRPGLG
jgi:hypothetical protein